MKRTAPRANAILKSLIVVVVASLLLGACRGEEVYPRRPIILVCSWAVGGGTDRVSRQLAVFLEHELGVPVNVVNATGGAGVTGHSRGARARPDGYTITMMTVELNMLHWRELTDITWSDFEPVALLNRDSAALLVSADDKRWQNALGLIEYLRTSDEPVTASGTAFGGIWHLALGGSLNAAGISPARVKWVPTTGAGPALQELASGGVDLVACSLPEARSLLAAGRVRALGVMSDQRVGSYAQVPTLKEQGINWSLGGWRGIGVPKGTPPEVVARLSEALFRIVSGQVEVGSARFPDYMASEGFDLSWQQPDEFRSTLASFDSQLGALLTAPEFASVSVTRFGPMQFPKLLFVLLGVVLVGLRLSCYLAGDASWRRALSGRRATEASVTDAGDASRRRALRESNGGLPSVRRVVLFAEFVAGVALFALLAELVGFILTAGGLLFYLLVRMGTRVWVSALVAVLLAPAVYGFFGTLMKVPLPRGLLGW